MATADEKLDSFEKRLNRIEKSTGKSATNLESWTKSFNDISGSSLDKLVHLFEIGSKALNPGSSRIDSLRKSIEESVSLHKKTESTGISAETMRRSLDTHKAQRETIHDDHLDEFDRIVEQKEAYLQKKLKGMLWSNLGLVKSLLAESAFALGTHMAIEAQNSFNKALIESNSNLHERNVLMDKGLETALMTGASFKDVTELMADMEDLGLTTASNFKEMADQAIIVQRATGMSAKSVVTMQFNSRLLNDNFTQLADTLATIQDTTTVTASEMSKYADSLQRAAKVAGIHANALIAENLRLEGGLAKAGGTRGDLNQFVTRALTTMQGRQQLGMFGMTPQQLKAEGGQIRLLEAMNRTITPMLANPEQRIAMLETYSELTGLSTESLARLNETLKETKEQSDSTTTALKRAQDQSAQTGKAFTQLWERLKTVVLIGFAPISNFLGHIANAMIEVMDAATQYEGVIKTIVSGSIIAMGGLLIVLAVQLKRVTAEIYRAVVAMEFFKKEVQAVGSPGGEVVTSLYDRLKKILVGGGAGAAGAGGARGLLARGFLTGLMEGGAAVALRAGLYGILIAAGIWLFKKYRELQQVQGDMKEQAAKTDRELIEQAVQHLIQDVGQRSTSVAQFKADAALITDMVSSATGLSSEERAQLFDETRNIIKQQGDFFEASRLGHDQLEIMAGTMVQPQVDELRAIHESILALTDTLTKHHQDMLDDSDKRVEDLKNESQRHTDRGNMLTPSRKYLLTRP